MKTIDAKTKNLIVNLTRLRGLVENIRKIEFHQKKAADLTECVLMQCRDIFLEGTTGKQQETR